MRKAISCRQRGVFISASASKTDHITQGVHLHSRRRDELIQTLSNSYIHKMRKVIPYQQRGVLTSASAFQNRSHHPNARNCILKTSRRTHPNAEQQLVQAVWNSNSSDRALCNEFKHNILDVRFRLRSCVCLCPSSDV